MGIKPQPNCLSMLKDESILLIVLSLVLAREMYPVKNVSMHSLRLNVLTRGHLSLERIGRVNMMYVNRYVRRVLISSLLAIQHRVHGTSIFWIA